MQHRAVSKRWLFISRKIIRQEVVTHYKECYEIVNTVCMQQCGFITVGVFQHDEKSFLRNLQKFLFGTRTWVANIIISSIINGVFICCVILIFKFNVNKHSGKHNFSGCLPWTFKLFTYFVKLQKDVFISRTNYDDYVFCYKRK